MLEKSLESFLDCKEIKPVNPKGNQCQTFIGRTDAEAETPTLWPPDTKNWLIGKDPNAGKDWRQEKGTTGDEMVGWHHWLNGHEFEQASGVGDGQGSLACSSPWGCKELDMTERLNWTEMEHIKGFPGGSDGKNLSATQGAQAWSLGWKDPLEEGMAPTPVFLPREFHGLRSLVGYSPWGRKESDITERLSTLRDFRKTIPTTQGNNTSRIQVKAYCWKWCSWRNHG